jgi:hypothetical protein
MVGLRPLPTTDEARLIDGLLRFHDIEFSSDRSEKTPTESYLDAIDTYNQQELFCGDKAAALVLGHSRAVARWWRRHPDLPTEEKIESLFLRPTDFPGDDDVGPLSPFARFELPGELISWMNAVQRLRRREHTWDSWNFLVTPLPKGDWILDVYCSSTISTISLARVSQLLADVIVSSWSSADLSVQVKAWRAAARFAVRTFSELLRDEYALFLKPLALSSGHGFAIVAPSPAIAVTKLRECADRCKDPKRKEELVALAATITASRSFASPSVCVVFLAVTVVVDRESNRDCTELDGVAGFIRDDALEWIVVQEKTGKQGTGRGQLETFSRMIRTPASTPKTSQLGGSRVSYIEIVHPTDRLSSRRR